ncbi:MAG TPA: cytochrome b/b6 domain-containing protein [Paracoccaceae bacterium]|nr:cytochrome b/b6 domain-containing protein [Paracoccaceae bacterium]
MTEPLARSEERGPDRGRVRAWDPAIRLFHWTTAVLFAANYLALDPEGRWHRWAGYMIAGLVVVRIFWGFVGPRPARFSAFPPSLRAARLYLAALISGTREEHHLSHNPLGALMVYNLLASLALLGVTGHMMGSPAFFGAEWVEELHEAVANWAFLSVLLHVLGVAVESRRSGINLVRAMISGWKNLPDRKT